jgi:Spy/CpxP family protein refolding chaperone
MNLTTRTVGGLAAIAALFSICAAAVAQDRPPADMQARHEARMHERMEEHLRRLHDILNLTPDQDAALKTVADAMAPTAGGEHHEGDWKQAQSLTTPERLDRMQARMVERQARFQRVADAIKRFYATLSPEQKRAFDALHEGMGGHGHGMKPWGMGGGPGMGDPGMGDHDRGGMGHGPDGAPPPAAQ